MIKTNVSKLSDSTIKALIEELFIFQRETWLFQGIGTWMKIAVKVGAGGLNLIKFFVDQVVVLQ